MTEETTRTTAKEFKLIIPKKYKSALSVLETERAIKLVKDTFEKTLAKELELERVSAPRFVISGTGINDDLNGIEKPVSFDVPGAGSVKAEIVHSLAKWKRMALADYGYRYPKGLYTDMDAIRPEEDLDSVHSIYVDQWDWEKIMVKDERNLFFLKKTVKSIYDSMKRTEALVYEAYPELEPVLPKKIHFIHAEELAEMYPDLSPRQRENEICQEHGAVFIIGIGGELKDGKPHDGRAPDYDDWSSHTKKGFAGLNGDIMVWNPVLKRAFEISSMGIRVDPEALVRQLEIQGKTERKELMWHRRLLMGTLPQTIGGGIGQSRLCMFFLRKAHIGEVHSSIWPKEMVELCRDANIHLL